MNRWQWIGVSGLIVAGVALAQPRLDRDGDGAVTLEEFEAGRLEAIRAEFARLDTDGDGRVTQAELDARRERFGMHRGEMAANVDTDGDGAWSLAELQVVRPGFTVEQFNRLDRNGDGLIRDDERPMRGRPGMHGRGPQGDADGGA